MSVELEQLVAQEASAWSDNGRQDGLRRRNTGAAIDEVSFGVWLIRLESHCANPMVGDVLAMLLCSGVWINYGRRETMSQSECSLSLTPNLAQSCLILCISNIRWTEQHFHSLSPYISYTCHLRLFCAFHPDFHIY